MSVPARRWHGWIPLAVVAAALLTWLMLPQPALYAGVSFSTLVTDSGGRPLRLLPAADGRYRLFTALDDIAPAARRATLLYEDRHFHRHLGVDPVALVRAAWTTYVRRTRVVGGSTITMQLARLVFDLDTRTPLGKLVQSLRALQIERHYGKDEILEAYLNLAPYGGSIEGIGTASRVYFDKPARVLGPGEALALAVVPQNPAARFPGTVAGRAKLMEARTRLLAAWRAASPLLDAETVARAELEPTFRPPAGLPYRAPHFVRDHVPTGTATVVRTTLDLDLQALLESRIGETIERRRRDGVVNAAAMLVDHQAMAVRALVGSAGFFDTEIAGQVNGVRGRRSPGSTLKPLLYGLALDAGVIHPMTLLEDAPRRYAAYAPENFDQRFLGPVFARDALIHSRNVPAVGLLASFGVPRFRDWLLDAGVNEVQPARETGLSLALGGSEVTLEELVGLYAILASGGVHRELRTVADSSMPVAGARLLSPEASYLVLDMLRDVRRPNASDLAPMRRPAVAWKTGTSFGFRDAWSVGVVGGYVLAVWVGNFDGSANPALVGREAAAPLFFAIADGLRADTETWWMDERGREGPAGPLQLRRVEVCATTGDLPGPHCPRTTRSWFIPGVSPIKVSTIYRVVSVDKATGLRSCRDDADTREEVYEFWPSNLHAVFRRAGIAIRRPPRWAPGCSLEETSATGTPPRIRSPQSTLVYHVPRDDVEQANVPFSAVADADARGLFWFVDDRLVARTAPGEDYLWTPRAGDFTVRVVDDAGRGASVEVRVASAPLRRRTLTRASG